MQTWEYCAIVGLSRYDVQLAPGRPAIWQFEHDGIDIVSIEGQGDKEAHEVARTISELGAEGWEMVGCANTSQYHYTVFFKRPIQV